MGIDFNSAGKNANPPISTPGYATPMTSKYAPKQTTTRGHTVQINNTEMYYEEYGAGKPLVLLHGFGGCAQNWHPFTAKLSERYRLIVADLRGHGGLAQALGYFDQAHFTRDFKRATGVSHGQYRLSVSAGAGASA